MKAQLIPQMIKDLFKSNNQAMVIEGDEFHRYFTGIETAVEQMNEERPANESTIKLICQDKVSGFYLGRPNLVSPKDSSNKPLIAWPMMVMSTDQLGDDFHFCGDKTYLPTDDIIFILKDWDTEWFLQPDGPKIVQQIRNFINSLMGGPQHDGDDLIRGRRMIIFTTSSGKIPPTLPELKAITIPLPDSEAMRQMIDVQIFDPIEAEYKRSKKAKGYEINESTRVLIADSLAGLTLQGAEDALSLGLVKNGGIKDLDAVLKVIEDAKARSAESVPGLTYIGKDIVDEKMPGYETVVDFINERVHMDESKLIKHNMKRGVNGMTLVGGPGTGKSKFASKVGALMKRPLYRWDLGETKGGVVGSTEAAGRRGVQILQAQRAVAWFDDIDKGVMGGGAGQAYSGDGGVTEGLIQMLLTQMASAENKITFIFTLNRIQNIKSPEMLRRGRMDRVYYVMRPNAATRRQILKTHVERRNFVWPTETGAMAELLNDLCNKLTDKFVPAELEALVEDTAYRSLMSGIDDLNWDLMVKLAKETTCMANQVAYKADLEAMEAMAEQFDKIGNVEDSGPVEAKTKISGRQTRNLVTT